MLISRIGLCALGSIGLTSFASAAVISVTSVRIPGSNSDMMAHAFDAQPVTDPVAGETSSHTGNVIGGFYGSDPMAGFDFGEDFASKTFTHIYLLQGTYGSPTLDLLYYWSNDVVYDAETDVAAPDFNIFNGYTGAGNSTTGTWTLQYENNDGVTPQARYLIGRPNGGTQGNFMFELAFVNVPEPASLALLGLGGVAILGGRRRG